MSRLEQLDSDFLIHTAVSLPPLCNAPTKNVNYVINSVSITSSLKISDYNKVCYFYTRYLKKNRLLSEEYGTNHKAANCVLPVKNCQQMGPPHLVQLATLLLKAL